jgi:hypothetical protein
MLTLESFKNGCRNVITLEPETRRIWASVPRLELDDRAVGKHIHTRSEKQKMSFPFFALLGLVHD